MSKLTHLFILQQCIGLGGFKRYRKLHNIFNRNQDRHCIVTVVKYTRFCGCMNPRILVDPLELFAPGELGVALPPRYDCHLLFQKVKPYARSVDQKTVSNVAFESGKPHKGQTVTWNGTGLTPKNRCLRGPVADHPTFIFHPTLNNPLRTHQK